MIEEVYWMIEEAYLMIEEVYFNTYQLKYSYCVIMFKFRVQRGQHIYTHYSGKKKAKIIFAQADQT